MFGFGKSERALKQLRSSLGIYVPGDRDAQKAILEQSPEATATAVRDIADGGDPYEVGAMLVAHYVRAEIAAMPADDQHRVLRVIYNEHIENLPQIIRLTAHVSLDLAKLEMGRKPIVTPGATGKFLDTVAEAFSPQENIRKRIASGIYACAGKIAERKAKRTG